MEAPHGVLGCVSLNAGSIRGMDANGGGLDFTRHKAGVVASKNPVKKCIYPLTAVNVGFRVLSSPPNTGDRPMSYPVTATYSVEMELSIMGQYQPGRPEQGPTYSSGGEPAEPDMIEDMDIDDITLTVHQTPSASNGFRKWLDVSILKGVDQKSEAYRQIVANILELIHDDAAEVLFREAAE